MGKRASVVFYQTNNDGTDIGSTIYLHWNGGAESIYPFLDEMERRGCKGYDVSFTTARFAHVACDYFDAEEAERNSVGILAPPATIDPEPPPAGMTPEEWGKSKIVFPALAEIDPGDNGVYLIRRDGKEGWNVRRFFEGEEKPRAWVKKEEKAARQHCYNTEGMSSPNNPTPETFAQLFGRVRPKISVYG